MSQLVLPQSIDAGTPAVASEVQSNFVAIRDLVNGNLEGGSGVNGNIKANGITDRELAHILFKYNNMGYTQGLTRDAADRATGASTYPVSVNANMTLNVGALNGLIQDDTPVVFDAGTLVPFSTSATTITLDPAHATLPRIDRIYARLTGYGTAVVEKVTGTPTAGAQTDYPLNANYNAGVGAIPADAIKIADIQVPAAAAAIVAANIVNRFSKWNRRYVWADYSGVSSVRTNTAFDYMPHPKQDRINGVMIDHEHAVVRVTYFANWRSSVSAAGIAAPSIQGTTVADIFNSASVLSSQSVATSYHPLYSSEALGLVTHNTASTSTDGPIKGIGGIATYKLAATGATPATPQEFDFGVMFRSTSGNHEVIQRHMVVEVISVPEG